MKHLKKDLAKFKELSPSNKLYVITAIVTVFIFSLLAVSSVFLQKELRQSQDQRRGAWNDQGVVDFAVDPGFDHTFENNESAQIDLKVNSYGHPLSSIQTSFKLYREQEQPGEVFSYDQIQLTTVENRPYKIAKKKITRCDDSDECFQIKALISNQNPLEPIVTNQNQTILSVEFLPQVSSDTEFRLVFDQFSAAIVDQAYQDHLTRAAKTYVYDVSTSNQQCSTPQQFDIDSLNCTDNQQANINFSWLALTETSGPTNARYQIQIADDPNFWIGAGHKLISYTTTDDEFGLENLGNGDWHSRVRVVSSQSCQAPSDWSPAKQFEVDCPGIPQCSAPNNLTLEYSGCTEDELGEATLTWDDLRAEDGSLNYTLKIADNPDFNNAQYVNVDNPTYSTQTLESGDWYAQVKVNQADFCKTSDKWSPILHFTLDCEQDQECEYIYHNDWGECVEGWQEQSYKVVGDECPEPKWDNWHRPCMVQCQYECQDWGECPESQIQTRECQAINKPCWDYVKDNYGETYSEEQYCEVDNFTDIKFGSYEQCWFGASNGVSTYISWSTEDYPQVGWIDVSENQDFSSFANKDVSQAQIIEDGYKITDGTDFKWNDSDQYFYFKPDKVYYARLYYSEDGGDSFKHSRTVSFRQTQCEDNDPDAGTQLCNEGCDNNNQCAQGLFCHEGRCRLPEAPDNDQCVDPDSLKACGQWCADDSECQDQYTCWYNYCRNPNNVDISVTDQTKISLSLDKARATNCADWEPEEQTRYRYIYYTPSNYTPVQTSQPTQTKGGQQTVTKGGEIIYTSGRTDYEVVGCNQACKTNRNCEPNHRCYQGQCRLAVNPKSPNCDPNEQISETKGGTTQTPSIEPIKEDGKDSSPSTGTAEPTKLEVTEEPEEEEQEPTGTDTDTDDETALDALKKYLQDKELSLPLMIGAGIAGLIVLIGLISLLSHSGSKRNSPGGLSDLEKNQFGQSSKNNKQNNQQVTKINSLSQTQQKPKNDDDVSPPPSSMVNRMKDKDIKKPGK
jgi:hypothetical protein